MKLTPHTCVQLFDLALNSGFTTTHSFLMFKEDHHLLETAYNIMEYSNRYSTKQLEYISTMLSVKTIHEHLMREGGLVSDFVDNDKKRYTMVMIDSESDDPLLNFTCLQFSENGLRTDSGRMSEKVSPDYNKIISSLSEGEHLIRYMNKPYADKYSEPTWIPVFLKENEMADPISGSGL